MYPYHWTWMYIFIVIVLLLSVFTLCCAVLLLRRSSHGAVHRTPESISTPLGYQSYWSEETRKLAAPGVARARERQYHLKGKE